MTMKKIAIRYVWNGNFLLDFITFFPFNVFYIYEEEPKEMLRHFLFVKLIRMAVTCAKLLAKDYGDSRLHHLANYIYTSDSKDD
jgi:hypothetical protein